MTLALKGKRDYIRGIDIYNHFIQKNFKDINIQFIKKLKYQPKLVNFTNLNKKKICCIIEYTNNKKKIKLYLVNSRKKLIRKKNDITENNEKKIFKNLKLKSNSISCNFSSNKKTIDILSLMFKFYHNQKIKSAKWHLTKLKLNSKLSDERFKNLNVKIRSKILDKFTIMTIMKNSKVIGKVYHASTD